MNVTTVIIFFHICLSIGTYMKDRGFFIPLKFFHHVHWKITTEVKAQNKFSTSMCNCKNLCVI